MKPGLQGTAGIAAALLAAVAAMAGCRHEAADEPPSLEDSPSAVADELAPPVVARAALSADTITLGDPLRYTLVVDARKGYNVELPPAPEKLGDFRVLDFGSKGPVKLPDGAERHVVWYDLDTYLTGEFTIPGMKITFTSDHPDEPEATIASGDVHVTLRSSLAAGETPQDIRDIKGPLQVPMDKRIPAAVAGALLTIAAACVGGARLYKRRRAGTQEQQQSEPPHLWALRELEALRSSDLLGRGFYREFYYALTHIVRCYIEARFGLAAPERTTEEFLAELSEKPVLGEKLRQLVADFLQEADLVKFARYEPSDEQVARAVASAGKLIEETAASPAQAEEGGGGD